MDLNQIYTTMVVSSGSFLNLKVWRKIGGSMNKVSIRRQIESLLPFLADISTGAKIGLAQFTPSFDADLRYCKKSVVSGEKRENREYVDVDYGMKNLDDAEHVEVICPG